MGAIKMLLNFNCLFLLATFLKAVPLGRRKSGREDLLCNLGDDHECVCNRSTGNLDKAYTPCHEFLEVRKLDVVNMVLRDINLSARLYTNETYESYLRRRIAQILSQYCENVPEDCPGTLAEIRSQRKMVSTFDLDEKTVTVLEDGPIFSKGNIVILRVQYPPGRERTELSFVVLKMANTVAINSALILYPTTVKYILSAQFAPLSRVLGGIKIEQFGIETLEKPIPSVDNTTLLIIVLVIGFLTSICCAIAAVKVFIDRRARRERRQNKETLTEKKSTRNYGTCTEKLFSNSNFNNCEVPNGQTKSKSISSRGSRSSKRAKNDDKKISKCSDDLAKVVVDEMLLNNDEEVSPRAAYNIFVCDHSQLPKEDGDEHFEMEMKRKKQNLNVQPVRSPFSSDDDTAFPAFNFPDQTAKRFSFSESVPCVILENGNEMGGRQKEEEELIDQAILHLNLGPKSPGGTFLSTVNEGIERPQSRIGGGGHPFDRPLSRRGSRDEKQDEGEEETFNDTREDTPVPLGDSQVLVEKPLIDQLKSKSKKIVEKLLFTSETDSEDGNADEDFEGVAPYKPLKSIEMRKEVKKEEKASSSESEREEKNECEMLERHQYERLLESPMPPATTTEMKITPKIILND